VSAKNFPRKIFTEKVAYIMNERINKPMEPVAWYIFDKDLATTDSDWAAENEDMCVPLYALPVDAKAIRECRNPKADEVRAYRDEHSVSMKQAYEKVKLELNAKAEKAGIKFTGGFVRVAEFVTEDELLELSKAIRAEALEEAAKVCDDEQAQLEAMGLDDEAWATGYCARQIRGLI
jgi:hypothetical protein